MWIRFLQEAALRKGHDHVLHRKWPGPMPVRQQNQEERGWVSLQNVTSHLACGALWRQKTGGFSLCIPSQLSWDSATQEL